MHAKFDDSGLGRSRDTVGAHQNLYGSRDLVPRPCQDALPSLG